MTYLTILEKLKILLDILLDYKIILIFTILLIILTLLYLVKILNKKKYILSMILSFIVVFSISIISNYKILSTTLLLDDSSKGILSITISLVVGTLVFFLRVILSQIIFVKYTTINDNNQIIIILIFNSNITTKLVLVYREFTEKMSILFLAMIFSIMAKNILFIINAVVLITL